MEGRLLMQATDAVVRRPPLTVMRVLMKVVGEQSMLLREREELLSCPRKLRGGDMLGSLRWQSKIERRVVFAHLLRDFEMMHKPGL